MKKPKKEQPTIQKSEVKPQPIKLEETQTKKNRRKKKGYHKHLFTPAPPKTWLAQAANNLEELPDCLSQPTPTVDLHEAAILADAHLQRLQEQQEKMLLKLSLETLLQEQAIASIVETESEDDTVDATEIDIE